jgi:transcriptional regulator with XRE-family HTH domain
MSVALQGGWVRARRHQLGLSQKDVATRGGIGQRTLRAIDAGERVLRADVACRAAARSLIGSGSQIGWIEAADVFREAMQHEGVPSWRRWVMYQGVLGGDPAKKQWDHSA